jgi:hypothetical protein
MPKAIHLDIPEPCHENWQQMTPNEQGRHCMSCQKTVVDFTMMSDKEVLAYFTKTTSHVCGRFANDQLQRDIAMVPEKKRLSLGYFWSMVIATFLVTGKTYAQGKPVVKKVKPVEQRPLDQPIILGKIYMPEKPVAADPVTLSGVVLDAQTREPLRGVSITIMGNNRGIASNSQGAFALKQPYKKKHSLEISCLGYETQVKELTPDMDWKHINIYLVPKPVALQSVEVVGYENRCYQTTVGLIATTHRVTKGQQLKRMVLDSMPGFMKKDVRVYPNPVVRGRAVNITLRLPQTGEYKGELIAAGGQVIAVQSIRITGKEQQVNIPTQTAWSAGIYWLRITHPQVKKVYQSKVIMQ